MVSILMPIYNGVYFMQESVSSILAQTQTEWELIVGINGYPPLSNVFLTAEAYLCSLNDSRIRLLDFPDCKGKSVTLNKMVPLCKYPYIALLDVDDIWLPNKLELQWPFLKLYDVIGTKCVYFGEMNNIIPAIPSGDLSAFNFLQVNPIINSSSIIRKDLAQWEPEWDGVEDYELWLRLWRENRRFYNCPEVQVKHRIHKTSAFNAKGNNNQVAALRAGGKPPTTPN